MSKKSAEITVASFPVNPFPPKLPGNGATPKEARFAMCQRIGTPVTYRPRWSGSENAHRERSLNVQNPPSVVELARALKNDVDLIFYHVHNNIDFCASWGVQKGSMGTLLDGIGNAFDQSQLLVDLLREAGHTASFVFGDLDLSNEQISNWLGTDSSNIFYAYSLLVSNRVPCEWYWTGSEYRIRVSHVWVKVTIGGTDCVLDPSFKSYTTTAGIDLGSAMNYDQSALLSAALTGATVETNGNWIQDVNYDAMKSKLTEFSTNLAAWIKTNHPTATMDDIIGGRSLIEIHSPVRQSELSYQDPNVLPTEWTVIPNVYRIVVQLLNNDYGINETLYGDEIYGKRFSLFYNSSRQPVIRLDGDVVVTGNVAAANSYMNVGIHFTHPYDSNSFDEWQYLAFRAPSTSSGARYYNIAIGFGPSGKGMVDFHRDRYDAISGAGGDEFDEDVLGEQIATIWFSYLAQLTRLFEVCGRMGNATFMLHHFAAVCGRDAVINLGVMDQQPPKVSVAALSANYASSAGSAVGLCGHALEALSIQQLTNTREGISANYILREANADGTKIYKATDSNWLSDVHPNLLNYGDMNLNFWVYPYLTSPNNFVGLVPEEGGQIIGSTALIGGFGFSREGGGLGSIFIKGGAAPWGWGCKCKCDPCEGEEADPVGLRTGAYKYRQSALTIGSSVFPYKLSFEVEYSSARRSSNGPLGLGWRHNWMAEIVDVSEPFRALGLNSPVEASAALVALHACVELLADTDFPVSNLLTAWLTGAWWSDQMTLNVVSAELLDSSVEFVRMADGTYQSTESEGWTLARDSGQYIVTSPEQVQYQYGTNGELEAINFPYGVTVALTYSAGKLVTIDNGSGRVFQLSYTDDKLSAVGDGMRAALFAYTSDNLTAITDPLGEDVTFDYTAPGLVRRYFLPENPNAPIVENTYDSLARVASQLDVYGNEQVFYFAGWRSEFQNTVGDSKIYHYDQFGNNVRLIDELGKETQFRFDGLSRVVEQIMPEGNRILMTYDNKNNVLTKTQKAKPGSSLADIVESYSWDGTFNSLLISEDGNGNVTTNSYDSETGQLIKIERTEVESKVPTVEFQYNARGQVVSRVDETGIQTQYSYDDITYDLLSVSVNTNWTATIGGLVTVSDELTITVNDPGLTGGQKSKSYAVSFGDSLEEISHGLADAINADSDLTGLGIKAKCFGSVILISSAPGNSTVFSQSTSGGATETITLVAGLGLTTTLIYNDWGDVISVQDGRGNATSYVFDEKRRIKQIVSAAPFNFVTNLTYDKNGNRVTVERQTGDELNPWQVHTATYNFVNQLTSSVDPDGNTTSRMYNELHQLWKVTDGENRTHEFLYTDRGQLESVKNPASVTVQRLTYSDNGKLLSIEDARDFITHYTYDGFDRLDKKIFPDSTFEQNVSYDNNGNVLNKLTRAGEAIIFEFDPFNRVIEKSPQGMPVVSISYDLSGRLKRIGTPPVIGEPASGDFILKFDSAGRFVEEESPDGKAVKYELDENNNITKIVYPDSWYVQRFYDELNRLTDIKLNGGPESAAHCYAAFKSACPEANISAIKFS